MTNPLVERLTRVYEAFAAGDPRAMTEFLADDVTYHLPGRHLGGGTLRGRGALFDRIAIAAHECDTPPGIRLLHVTGVDPLVVSFEQVTARRRGRVLDQPACVVWRIADGRCVEVWSHFADQAACDTFWEGLCVDG